MLFIGLSTAYGATEITSLPYVINQSGSFFISQDLTLPSYGTGIQVNSNNVSIDLRGHSIIGTSLSGTGISMSGRTNVEIMNGTVRSFHTDGIHDDTTSGKSHRIINVRTVENGRDGIHLQGSNHLVKDCTASDNGRHGIYTLNGSTITGNVAYHNGYTGGYGGSGIAGNEGIKITGNMAYGNNTNGIQAGGGSAVSGNISYQNGYDGISVSDSVVTDNNAYDNVRYGINSAAFSTIIGNTASKNGMDGIFSYNGATIVGNTVYDNGNNGINGGGTVKNNSALYNQFYGILLNGGKSLVDGNTAKDNNQSGGGYSNISSCSNCTFGINYAP